MLTVSIVLLESYSVRKRRWIKKMYIKWTDAEDNIMKEYYPKIGVMVADILPAISS